MNTYSITRLLVMKKSVENELTTLLSSKESEISTVIKSTASQAEKDKLRAKQKSLLDRMTAAMRKRDLIATAIAESNAKTTVTINGVGFTVTAAIDRKNNIEKEKQLCNLLTKAGTAVQKQLDVSERQIENEVAQRAQILVGRDKAVTKEALDLVKASVEDTLKLEVVEPCDLLALVMEKRASIDSFMAEIDIALNESNATTKIELDLTV